MAFEHKYDQWTLQADEEGYRAFNEDEDGMRQYYEMQMGPYGNPIFVAEPDLGMPIPTTVDYMDRLGDFIEQEKVEAERIAGVICKKAGEVMHRFSLSNPPEGQVSFENEGAEVVINDVRWHLHVLFSKDKNRIKGYDAFYSDKKRSAVLVLELEDLNF